MSGDQSDKGMDNLAGMLGMPTVEDYNVDGYYQLDTTAGYGLLDTPETPEVLKNIYGTINTDNLLFLSSVNHINDIVSLANQSGLAFWGVEENNIGHTMRTLLLDKKLRLIKTFDGDNWKAAEVKESIENLLKFYN